MGRYTTSELERDTGFGRRTIAYYVQEGLLPRVGRRGPRTRYPELVRDRLLFIRRAREAEAESEIRPVPLRAFRQLFKVLPPELVASVAAGDTPVTADLVSLAVVGERSSEDRAATLKERLAGPRRVSSMLASRPGFVDRTRRGREGERMSFRAEAPSDPDDDMLLESGPASPFEDDIAVDAAPRYPRMGDADEDADILAHELSWALNELRSRARHRRELAPDAIDTWSQVEVTPDIRLSIRGLADEDAGLLRVTRRLLRQLLESRGLLRERRSGEAGE